jgi:hypothetical protein
VSNAVSKRRLKKKGRSLLRQSTWSESHLKDLASDEFNDSYPNALRVCHDTHPRIISFSLNQPD